MRDLFNAFCRAADRLSLGLAMAVRWLGLLMVVVTLLVVLLRYFFNTGAIMLQESVIYMHGIFFLLGIPYGLYANSHVRVDLLYSGMNPRTRALVDACGHLLLLLPLSVMVFVTSLPYVAASWRVLEGSAEVGGLPALFLLKTLIPITAALMFLQGLSELTKRVFELITPGEPQR